MTELQSENHNSKSRQFVAAMIFALSFITLFVGIFLWWVEYSFIIGLIAFAILQTLSLLIVTDKIWWAKK